MLAEGRNDVWKQIPEGHLNVNQFVWLIFGGFLLGIIIGFVIAFFRITAEWTYNFVSNWAKPDDISGFEIFLFFIAAILAALVTGFLIRNKAIRGGGAAWENKALAQGQKHTFLKILVPKFIGSWLVMASGVSVGREGPSIQIGAATALSVMRGKRDNVIKRRFYILGGCAAGLAATFSAPFTGICFVYEVKQEKISRLLLLFMLAGSFGVYVAVQQICGLGVIVPFNFTPLPAPPLFLLLVPLALFAGLTGIVYNYCLRYSLRMYAEQKFIPIYLRPLFPFIGAALMLLFFPAITGEGLAIFNLIEHGTPLLSYLFLFLAAKLLFTAFCYGSGIPAGLMVPILCLGGVTGAIYADICVFYNLIPQEYLGSCMVLGMAGAYAAAERAPITGLVLTLEVTGAWVTAPAILLVTAIASLFARLARVQKV